MTKLLSTVTEATKRDEEVEELKSLELQNNSLNVPAPICPWRSDEQELNLRACKLTYFLMEEGVLEALVATNLTNSHQCPKSIYLQAE